jgi:hypothetical protein
MGRLIPAGTGFEYYRNVRISAVAHASHERRRKALAERLGRRSRDRRPFLCTAITTINAESAKPAETPQTLVGSVRLSPDLRPTMVPLVAAAARSGASGLPRRPASRPTSPALTASRPPSRAESC